MHGEQFRQNWYGAVVFSLATLVLLKWMQSPVELHSQPNVSTLQSSVFIRGDLKLRRGFFIYSMDNYLICQQGGDTLVVNNYRNLYIHRMRIHVHMPRFQATPLTILAVMTLQSSHAIACLVSHTHSARADFQLCEFFSLCYRRAAERRRFSRWNIGRRDIKKSDPKCKNNIS